MVVLMEVERLRKTYGKKTNTQEVLKGYRFRSK